MYIFFLRSYIISTQIFHLGRFEHFVHGLPMRTYTHFRVLLFRELTTNTLSLEPDEFEIKRWQKNRELNYLFYWFLPCPRKKNWKQKYTSNRQFIEEISLEYLVSGITPCLRTEMYKSNYLLACVLIQSFFKHTWNTYKCFS